MENEEKKDAEGQNDDGQEGNAENDVQEENAQVTSVEPIEEVI